MTFKGYTFEKGYQTDDKKRIAMNALATDVFGGLSFEDWYRAGYWLFSPVPYSLFDGDACISNLFANTFTLMIDGRRVNAMQLGTVMTREDARGKGLSRFLMDRAIEDWRGQTDVIYLYGNDSVKDFYPLFGFKEWTEYDVRISFPKGRGEVEKLDITNPSDLDFIKRMIALGNPYARVTVENRLGIMMFHIMSFYRDCLYRIKEPEALAILIREDGELTAADLFTKADIPLEALLSMAADGETSALLGFLPDKNAPCEYMPSIEEDNHCFVMGEASGLLTGAPMRLPLLCRT